VPTTLDRYGYVRREKQIPINNFTNMRRVNTRGLASANKHVLMAALTYNLKKYMKRPWKNRKTLSLSMQIPQMDLGKGLSGFFGLVKRLSGRYYRPHWAI